MRHSIAIAAMSLALTGCVGAPTSTAQPSRDADNAKGSLHEVMQATLPQVASNATVYNVDEITIQDGSRSAAFFSSSKILHGPSGLTVVDAVSGQTFHFSPQAVVRTTLGTGRVVVEPGHAVPAYARQANAQRSATRSLAQ